MIIILITIIIIIILQSIIIIIIIIIRAGKSAPRGIWMIRSNIHRDVYLQFHQFYWVVRSFRYTVVRVAAGLRQVQCSKDDKLLLL